MIKAIPVPTRAWYCMSKNSSSFLFRRGFIARLLEGRQLDDRLEGDMHESFSEVWSLRFVQDTCYGKEKGRKADAAQNHA